jgi:hypothetical protein
VGVLRAISLAIFNRIVAVLALKKDRKLKVYKSQKRKGAVEILLLIKVGFKYNLKSRKNSLIIIDS